MSGNGSLAAGFPLAKRDRHGEKAAPSAAELTVVIPTLKERENVPILTDRLAHSLSGIAWEAVFVDDDSVDGTAKAVKALARINPRIRCIRRVGRKGLAGAAVEGMLSSAAPFVAVMDGDLQHDDALLMAMLEKLRGGEVDLVVASRFLPGGSSEGLSDGRRQASTLANAVARRLLRVTLSDPMSGFFMVRREVVDSVAGRLSDQGFKVLLDLVATCRGTLRISEVPCILHHRSHGESKLDGAVAVAYLGLFLEKWTEGLLSTRFLMFGLVGTSGIVVHLVTLRLTLGLGFSWAQGLATVVAMTSNYIWNNRFTYRDRSHRGWRRWLSGLAGFYAICGLGAVANVGVATLIYHQHPQWWLAGIGGAFVGIVWNYTATSLTVWRGR